MLFAASEMQIGLPYPVPESVSPLVLVISYVLSRKTVEGGAEAPPSRRFCDAPQTERLIVSFSQLRELRQATHRQLRGCRQSSQRQGPWDLHLHLGLRWQQKRPLLRA